MVWIKWAAIASILLTAFIHLVEAPEYFEAAAYLGLLFVANGIGGLVAAAGIWRGNSLWGWGLGAVVAGGAFAAYVVSRATGLPGLGESEFFEPAGILSLVVEGLFIAFYAMSIRGGAAQRQRG